MRTFRMNRSTKLSWPPLAAAVVALLILVGPRATIEERWVEPEIGADVAAYLSEAEAGVEGIEQGAEKGVVWADPEARDRTDVALVYLHGFSADRHEVDPLVQTLADSLGANAFFTRLSGHVMDGAALGDATAEAWLDDAAEAVVVGEAIGESVVLLGTSTGATLAIWAAAQEEAAGRVDALVLLSPNFGPRDPNAQFLLWPWGGALARAVIGPERCFEPANERQARHWTTCYPTEALLPMMALVERSRTLDLERVTTPTLMLYSPDDQVVDPDRSVAAFGRFGGVPKRLLPVEASPYAAYHVLAGDILSPETTTSVAATVLDFLRPVLEAGS